MARQVTCTVVLVPEPEGESRIVVAALAGCFSGAKTVNEALRNAEEAVCCHLASILQHGEEIPQEGDTLPPGGLPSGTTRRIIRQAGVSPGDLSRRPGRRGQAKDG